MRSTSQTPYLMSVDMTRSSALKPSDHSEGWRYRHACTSSYASWSVAMACRRAASFSGVSNVARSINASGDGMIESVFSSPK